MKCPKCNQEMRLLFISYACDRCDGLVADEMKDESLDFRGFIVIDSKATLPQEHYVFATRADATKWRDLNYSNPPREIKEVRGSRPFRWYPSRGTVRGIILADRLFEVYPADHKYDSRPNRCSLHS